MTIIKHISILDSKHGLQIHFRLPDIVVGGLRFYNDFYSDVSSFIYFYLLIYLFISTN